MGDVLGLRGLGEFEGCKAVKELADLRLIEVVKAGASEPSRVEAPAPKPDQGNWADTEVADLSGVWEEGSDNPEEAEEASSAESAEPVNRGLLLKFLGSARN
jgi:hypothetical protein